jgi:hypothetical protein
MPSWLSVYMPDPLSKTMACCIVANYIFVLINNTNFEIICPPLYNPMYLYIHLSLCCICVMHMPQLIYHHVHDNSISCLNFVFRWFRSFRDSPHSQKSNGMALGVLFELDINLNVKNVKTDE